MHFVPNQLYHIYNRGNNKQKIFFNRSNYLFFLKKFRKAFIKYSDVLSYCLMPNHFHFLIYTKENLNNEKLIRAIATSLSSYSQAINKKENRTGNLFQQKTKAKPLTEDHKNELGYIGSYGLVCLYYIHQNPLRAKLTEKMEDWEFSSFKDYLSSRNSTIVNKKLAIELFGIETGETFYEDSYRKIKESLFERMY